MSTEELSPDQKKFLKECDLEFSERFTDNDLEFKKILDSDIPAPPIISPWYDRQRFNNRDRDRPSGSYNNYRNFNENSYRDNRRDRYRPY
ncbi:uncharacterized protein LOC130892151 [Diorhabda carinulata]|uniref:uncharacterized protein LOC130892151 n=1 Tax=Diorhabda carinulata TaxID=1163345 RepID=UPI0025A1BED5|nr:uncharacterized protein LOC130892151 [Diorhabda carinulata]